MRLEAEVGRLAQAIPARGGLPAFVEAMSVGNIPAAIAPRVASDTGRPLESLPQPTLW
jgi:hypothetical protein